MPKGRPWAAKEVLPNHTNLHIWRSRSNRPSSRNNGSIACLKEVDGLYVRLQTAQRQHVSALDKNSMRETSSSPDGTKAS